MEREIVERYIRELDYIAEDSLQRNKMDDTLTALRASAKIQYHWNQSYIDEKAEQLISHMVDGLKLSQNYRPRENVVLFYDGFGLDTRGLALIYVKALCELGYELIYVVPKKAKGRQPEIRKIVKDRKVSFIYLDYDIGFRKITELLRIFRDNRPKRAFFYTVPEDAEACVAFVSMKEKCIRYQINLTDHAFWLGKNAFDICIEFREYGACISNQYRHIVKEQLQMLPYYPFVDIDVPFAGFDFETKGKKILFSGGSLYKTIGGDGKFYYMVEELLRCHADLLFLYAGEGDDSGLKKLQELFGERCIHINERKDLYAVMRHITLYLNTYPLAGGLMSQYAVAARKLPLTLVAFPATSLDGLIINRSKVSLEFLDTKALLEEANHLLVDNTYRKQQERKMVGSLHNEVEFRENLRQLLQTGKTSFPISLHFIDTSSFCNYYKNQFTEAICEQCIINRKNHFLWRRYPVLFGRRIYKKLFHKN